MLTVDVFRGVICLEGALHALIAEAIGDATETEDGGAKVERVYGILNEMMRRQHFTPGVQINIRALARYLNVSPTPIREALLRLACEEAVVSVPGFGFFSKSCTVREMAAEYELASIIAASCIRSGLKNFNGDGLQVSAVGSEPPYEEQGRKRAAAIEALYIKIAGLTTNHRMVTLMQQFNNRTSVLRELELEQASRAAEASNWMRLLLHSLNAHDEASAAALLAAGFEEALRRLPALVKEVNARAVERAGLLQESRAG